MSNLLLSVRNLHVIFAIHQNKKWPWSAPHKLHAVNDISFDLIRGKTLGIVGESGCGKSTLIRAIAGLVVPTSGDLWLDSEQIDHSKPHSRASILRKMQMVFQDPIASLNPRMTIGEIIQEPLAAFFPNMALKERNTKASAMLDRVGIAKANYSRYPHEFSGGQCQRIGIARALISRPELLLCDEPVSALDVSIQAQVVNLLMELQQEMGLTIIFVAHNLGVVHHIADDILVMYLGGMMEYAPASHIIHSPQHPYTQALLSAVPEPNPSHKLKPQLLSGDLPSPLNLPKGCLFSTRCPKVIDACQATRPAPQPKGEGSIACIRAL